MTEAAPKQTSDEYVRTEFLERVAHDLRGPAGVALGALQELEFAIERGNLERLKILLPMARRGIGSVLRTADKLDRAAQLERSAVEWTKERQDIRDLVRKSAHDAELLERRKGVNVVVSATDDAALALVDTNWVTHALGELIINAIRHADKFVSVDTTLENNSICVTIVDDGKGFAFSPPSRFEPPQGRRGLSLSLPLARDVAQAHGGELIIERTAAESGAGTAPNGNAFGGYVRFVLPRA